MFVTIQSLCLFCLGQFIVYLSCAWIIPTLWHHYICDCIDRCLPNIPVFHWYVCIFLQYTHWLHFILGVLCYNSPMRSLFYHYVIIISVFILICLWMLYLCLMWYVDVIYKIYSLVGLHLSRPTGLLYHFCPLCWTEFKRLYQHLLVWIYHLSVTCIEPHNVKTFSAICGKNIVTN